MSIPKELLEVTQNASPGYHPLTRYSEWLVAVLNEGEANNSPDKVKYLEYHAETDEVFILLGGNATLLISGGKDKPQKIEKTDMEPMKCYNVRKGVWHGVVLENGGSVAIVENANTSRENSVYYNLTDAERKTLL